ncbi:MAG: GGDEF domain-containing protein [Coriobacteriia bacterium]|nr:GGDEF domain-containing protein [Coriobacteriia bacterium]MCL2749952.1 GGDEF domain-containing protein [Coriobacteriia bacterium]
MRAASSKSINDVVAPKILLVGMGAVAFLLVATLLITLSLTLRNNAEAEEVLIQSVRKELIASSTAGMEIISGNIDLFKKINSQEDVNENWDAWVKVVNELRVLNYEIGGAYIYALKEIDGVFYFVFDTDFEAEETRENFTPYELSPVHEEAFAGRASADVSNVVDEWGSFNTGAVPLFDGRGNQVGIVATDIEDTFIVRHRETSAFYTTVLVITTSFIAVMMMVVLFMISRHNSNIRRHLFELANFDSVSGLPNRNNLFSFLAREIDFLREHQRTFAVFFIDLDNFKAVNDSAGHDVGDVLLRSIASFLKSFAGQSDYDHVDGMEALTARIGGDEFLQLVPGISSTAEASVYAQQLLDSFGKEPSLLEYINTYGLGMSIGISLFPSMQTDYDELIKYADIAMYHAKDHGKNNYKVYDLSMGDDVEGAELIVRKNKGNR